jgi:hypothetical protein
MFHLEQSGIRIAILDPIADRARLGSRYCVGGYVWQATDSVKGDIFSGPKFPDPNPSPFDGQGCPEVFEIALGQQNALVGEEVYVIGVGRVLRESAVKPFHVRNNFTVVEFTPWEVNLTAASCVMKSRQTFQNWDLQLTRSISLESRTLVSTTSVQNFGSTDLPLRWFAHPFFPHAGFASTRFSVECDLIRYLPDIGGFRFNASGYLERIPEYAWKSGGFQLLNLPFGFPMTFQQKHPWLGEIEVDCRFPVAWLPVWSNDRTISLEPYHHTLLKSSAQTEWSIRYAF